MHKNSFKMNNVYKLNLVLDSVSYADSNKGDQPKPDANPPKPADQPKPDANPPKPADQPQSDADQPAPEPKSLEQAKNRPFHLSEDSDEEKHKKIEKDLGKTKTYKRPLLSIMELTVERWFEILIELIVFVFMVIPENYEFIHVLKEKYLYHKEKTKTYKEHTLAEKFDVFCPILEGILCVINTFIFVMEFFLGIEMPYSLIIAIVSSHIICIIILIHVELIDRAKVKQRHIVITYSIEAMVIILSVLITLLYIKTGDIYQELILIATILIDYLCRTLTRTVLSTHDKFRKVFNSGKVRIILFSSIGILVILTQLLYIYFFEVDNEQS